MTTNRIKEIAVELDYDSDWVETMSDLNNDVKITEAVSNDLYDRLIDKED